MTDPLVCYDCGAIHHLTDAEREVYAALRVLGVTMTCDCGEPLRELPERVEVKRESIRVEVPVVVPQVLAYVAGVDRSDWGIHAAPDRCQRVCDGDDCAGGGAD